VRLWLVPPLLVCFWCYAADPGQVSEAPDSAKSKPPKSKKKKKSPRAPSRGPAPPPLDTPTPEIEPKAPRPSQPDKPGAGVFTLTSNPSAPGFVQGTVTDPSGAIIPDASIELISLETGRAIQATTNANGSFSAPAVPGHYSVEVAKPGFQPIIVKEFEVRSSGTPQVDVAMQVANRDIEVTGRSYVEIEMLNPALVNFTQEKTGGIDANSANWNNLAVSGIRQQQTIFLLNGIEFTGAPVNNMQSGGTSQELLGVDAVRDFSVLGDSYGAGSGKRPGAQVRIITRSGSNVFHGSVHEFLRNSAFDARNFFDPSSVPGFQRNQFGASLGAPVRKDTTFVFGNYEGFRQHLHQTGVDLVPDANARNGYLPCKVVNPAPNPCPASGLAFVGVSPLISAWPAPSAGAPDFGGISETFNDPLQTIRRDFGTIRLDHIFSPSDDLSAFYTVADSADFTPTSTNLYSTDVVTLREQVASLEEMHVSTRLVNTARVGFSRSGYFFTGEPTPNTPAAVLPGFLPGIPLGALVVGGSAASNPASQLSLAGSNNGSNLKGARNLCTYEDRVSLIRGAHYFDFGVWFQRLQSNELLALSQYGQATFTSLQTFLQGSISSLLYDPAPTPLGWRSLLGAFYAEDVIRLTPQLTVSLGFRDEFSTGWNEVNSRASTYTFINGIISTQPHIGSSTFQVNNAKFLPQPRIGIAWSPFANKNQTVIHASFGMYNDLQDALGYRMDQNAPFNPTYSISNLAVSKLPLSSSLPSTAKLVPGGVQPDLQTPTLISWSLRVQHEIAHNTALSVGYLGSHGYHEILGVDANEPFPVICPASPCPAVYPSTFPAGIAGTPVPAGTYYVPTATKPNAALGNTWTYFSEGDSSYNELQIKFEHNVGGGLSLRGAYTWSKAIDNGNSGNATTSGGEPSSASNPFNLRTDRGLANFDVRNAAAISAVYELPFGHRKRFLANATGFGSAMTSGWSINSIVVLKGGFPFTPQLSYNPSNNGDTRNPVRPFVNPAFGGPVILGSPSQWFNPAAFLAPPNNSGVYGNLGRNTLIGPSLATWDLGFLKDTPIRERFKLQFRAEIFNFLNRANFDAPNVIAFTPSGVSPTAGLLTSTSTPSRQIQFGLKLLW